MIAELGALAAVAAAFFLRAVFIRRRGAERVDEYYWCLIARAARLNRRPPYVLPGKYLLEEENQYYPPLFGFVLSFVPERWIAARGPWLSHLPDALLIVAALAVLRSNPALVTLFDTMAKIPAPFGPLLAPIVHQPRFQQIHRGRHLKNRRIYQPG